MIEFKWARRRASFFPVALGLSSVLACSAQQPGPQLAPSSGEAAYAESYPDKVAQSRERLSRAEADAARISGDMASYPDALKSTDYATANEVVTLADGEGKSSGHAQHTEEAAVVRRFASEEKEKLGQQTSGAVRYVLSEKGASQDVVESAGSAAARGQEKAIQKQLEERQRRASPAQRLIEDNEELLGKPNVETLSKQAEEITRASYIVNVELVEEKARLEQMVQEASEIKKTLTRSLEDEQKVVAGPKTSARRKKVAQERIAATEQAQGRVDEEKQNAENELRDLEKRATQLKDAYKKALDTLHRKLEELAASQPPRATD